MSKIPLNKGLLLPTKQNVSTTIFALSQVTFLMLLFFRKHSKALNAFTTAANWYLCFGQVFDELRRSFYNSDFKQELHMIPV
ncbi:MAG: hypothetical protein DCF22_05610 [Leptolyngbya sp.]|nr:MAG: hypothetical protein DCF22_05610 [Leptolyngbya sp.]